MFGCSAKESGGSSEPSRLTMLTEMDSLRTGIAFTNRVRNTDEFNIFSYRNFYNGGGVGIGDVNNDGLPDIYLTANQGSNKLYLNRGDWQFEDVSATAGIELSDHWSTGVTMVDVNADGWLDIYVCNAGFQRGVSQQNSLFINNRDGTFAEGAAAYGLDDNGYSTHAAFFDYDLDGDLDVYLLNNSFIPVNTLNNSNQRERYAADWDVQPFLRGGGDRLLRNDGGEFTDVTKSAGIYGSLIGFGLGVTVGDVNGDYYPDIYVSNDFFERDYLYINQQNGTFREEVERYMRHLSLASMGADLADINNDGHPELFATEMLPETDYRRKTTVQFENVNSYALKQQRGFYHQYMHNTLQLNNGDGSFSEIAQYAGVEATDWSWGALLFDVDQDGWRDIFVSNGIYHNLTSQDFIDFFADDVVRKMALTGEKEEIDRIIERMPSEPIPNKLYRNRGDLTFEDVADQWGMGTPSFSNGAAYGDLDGDGDLDLVVSNVNQPLSVYQNHADSLTNNHHLTVQLVGDSMVNPFAVGATIHVHQAENTISAMVMPSRGFQSSVDYAQSFGLGADPAVDSVVVVWPDLSRTVVTDVLAGNRLTINKASKSATPVALLNKAGIAEATLLTPANFDFQAHREDDFQDLLREGLVMRSLANEGPRAVAGDMNGDGQDDLYVGGAGNQPGQMYLQQGGRFVLSEQPALLQVGQTEDTGLAMFDADGDGDLDLYVGSGGNSGPPNSMLLADKLFFNDGKGNLTLQPGSLPRIGVNTSVVIPVDFDGDGDQDLFVGTRSLPGNYGVPVPSFLLENNGRGRFRDATRAVAPQFATLGMVTGAVLDTKGGDRGAVLTTVSEWGTPRQFRFVQGGVEEIKTNLQDYAGWWYAAALADLNGDGLQDLILGNRGENFYFSADSTAPARLFVADFDGNGTMEKIVTQHLDGRDMPIVMKRDLTAELPGLRKQNLRHTEYAKRSIDELFAEPALRNATVLSATYFKSAVAYQQPDGTYDVQPLPARSQLSTVQAITVIDLNADGWDDVILGGNDSGFRPQYSRQDASYGDVLLNDRGRGFRWLAPRESGFRVVGDLRDLVTLQAGGAHYLFAAINDAPPLVFRLPSEVQ